MSQKVTVAGYQTLFKLLTKKRYEQDRTLFDKAVILIRLDELQARAMRMRRINKPTYQGTKITFEAVKNTDEYNAELQRIVVEGEHLGLNFETKK